MSTTVAPPTIHVSRHNQSFAELPGGAMLHCTAAGVGGAQADRQVVQPFADSTVLGFPL